MCGKSGLRLPESTAALISMLKAINIVDYSNYMIKSLRVQSRSGAHAHPDQRTLEVRRFNRFYTRQTRETLPEFVFADRGTSVIRACSR